ncbi:selenocysteine synthase [Candidatus Magnetomorum sp. HK-1]|nr:selenocysteine synthase [Candidatus Magnetomorum sp. HK-1]
MHTPDYIQKIPKVDKLYQKVSADATFQKAPRSVTIRTIQQVLEKLRKGVLEGNKTASDITESGVLKTVKEELIKAMRPNLTQVINASGVIVHTNLGRSVLSPEVLNHISHIAGHYSNLEFNLATGKRGQRYSIVEPLICSLTGAESATAVNNNAGAVLIALQTMAAGKEVIVSRGELVEIGGSFRIPDIMALSGARMVEVGTTNRTHLRDYENAITPETGLLLKVHQSNYAITGFTASVSLKELLSLGRTYNIPVMNDLGSGNLVDLSIKGLMHELTVQETLATGVDIATFSGDKLLGGPQAGIIVGKKSFVSAIKKHPMARALRIDKLTLAALEATLRLYQNPKTVFEKVPTLRLIERSLTDIKDCAEKLCASFRKNNLDNVHIDLVKKDSKIGGGALPLQTLPTYCISIKSEDISSDKMDQYFRSQRPSIVGRIENDQYLLDCRTILPDEISIVENAMHNITL